MTFDSLTFVLFLAVVLVVDRGLARPDARKSFLLVASALFYAAWNPPFILLVALSTVLDFFVMHRIAAATDSGARRWWLALSVSANLGLLGVFKYGAFLVENTERALTALGVEVTLAAPDLVLPVGISFYTFQTLSTTIDVYRRTLAPPASLRDYALFVAFFPQLVAGPIVRGRDFLPQLDPPPRAGGAELRHGLALVVLGLALKTGLADGQFARTADLVFDDAGPVSTGLAWCGVLAFSGQIFCDFAGYSLVAVGAALALGFTLPDNFRAPYAARGLSDFWRRWHITLSSWLRDYLYVSLGGNRHGALRTAVNLTLTMFLGGLWHGASWTFVVWGLVHGAFLVVEHAVVAPPSVRARLATASANVRRAIAGLGALVTLFAVVVAWVPFRATSLGGALSVGRALVGLGPALSARAPTPRELVPVVLFALLVAWHHVARELRVEDALARVPPLVRAAFVALAALLVVVSAGEDRAFLYFQF